MMTDAYALLHRRSLQDPDSFWSAAAEDLEWYRRWDTVLSYDEDGMPLWFAGGQTNTCWNALDRHVVAGRGDRVALIYDSPVTGTRRKLTYSQLKHTVERFAGVLTDLGVRPGDRVLIYMSLVPEAVVAMLACARIGAVHSVVFGGFAARELASRIADAQPSVVIATSCGIEPTRVVPYKQVVDAAIEQSGASVKHCIILQRPQLRAELMIGRDHDWDECMTRAQPRECVPVSATDPLYIIYTSGTTGQPKGLVRPSGGHLVALKWSMSHIYDLRPGEVFWCASDIGWVVGHSYIVYGPLLHGGTTVLYEGKPVGTPDAGAYWRVIQEHEVAVMFSAPTAIRAIRQQDPNGSELSKYDLSHFRALFLAGERCDPATLGWVEKLLSRPVIDHWWQTETGWPIAANPLGIERFPVKPGSVAKPMPGWDVRILSPEGREVPAGHMGAIACKLPLPPGAATTLWKAPERYRASYLDRFPGFYHTGDAGFVDEDGYLHVMTRTDDVINVAGHRLSTGAIEEAIATHASIAECAVVGFDDALKGQVPLGLLVLKSGVTQPHAQIVDEVIAHVRHVMGAVVAFKKAIVVPRLPKTRSGKILRGTIAQIVNGKAYVVPATIEDERVLEDTVEKLTAAGFIHEGAQCR